MNTISRQQALIVAEAWQNIYTSVSYVDFQSYTQDNLVNAIVNYIQINYPNDFNDFISNSELIILIRTIAFLHENISYRFDLSIRENFVQTATRRDSTLYLADNVFYNANRVSGGSGALRIASISTNQPLTDSNGNQLANTSIYWSDPTNENWLEQFTLIMNSAFVPRTQYGFPLVRYTNTPVRTDLYMFNSIAPTGGVYPFTVQSSGNSLPFEFINATLDPTTGVLSELAPNATNALLIYYNSDGLGTSSAGTGFFLPIKQGSLSYIDQNFSTPTPMQQVILSTPNINNTDIYVQQLDTNGNVIANWQVVDSIYGQGVGFNTLSSAQQNIYEISTLVNDQVLIQFGDGKFGAIPTDNFRFWYRTSNPLPQIVNPDDIQNQTFLIPYVSNSIIYFLTVSASLSSPITNASGTDTNAQILQNMGGAFAAQNRMVTGADYNLFPLSDTSILKLNAVNRTYSGHSAYSKINDPTGLYEGIRITAKDGRLYQDNVEHIAAASADTSMLTINELINQYINPTIQTPDKITLYNNEYPLVLTTNNPVWIQTSVLNMISSGIIEKFSQPIPVGSYATDEFQYLTAGSYMQIINNTGAFISIQNVVGNGTANNAITLNETLSSGSLIYGLLPPLRTVFNATEITNISTSINQLQNFALSWYQSTQSWQIITNSNIDATDDFSLTHQGDTSNNQLDASWMVYLKYIPASQTGFSAQWQIIDRGIGIFFESSNNVDFVYTNYNTTIDVNTGKMVIDNVDILGCNEAINSPHRLGTGSSAIYLINDQIWNVSGPELTPDGYTDSNGIEVVPVDTQFDGIADNPFQFNDFVDTDGVTDLVLWQSIIQDGFSVWSPIDLTTNPRGLYGSSGGITVGVVVDTSKYLYGDIYFNTTSVIWLVADSTSGNWVEGIQNNYKSAIGRSQIQFLWTHYPGSDTRIDPAISNIIDMYVLTQSYDTAYRDWISSGFVGDMPVAPTSQALETTYSYLNNNKISDDVMIWHSIGYKPLFGIYADPTVQCNFLLIQSSGSLISQNDLKLEVLNALNTYFAAQYWNPGDTIYFSELSTYIHTQCAPDLQSIVIVSKTNMPFGELYQIRSSSDQLFISVAQASDIQVVSSYTAQNLNYNLNN